MSSGVLSNTGTAPGGFQGGTIDNVMGPGSSRAGTIDNVQYVRSEYLDGPDAQPAITHRTWDPFDRLQPTSALKLCANAYFESVEEIFDGEGTPFDASGVRTYVRRFRVKTRYTTMLAAAVCSCPGIPRPYAPYVPGRRQEWDPYARVVQISARRELASSNEFTTWIVEVNYSTAMPDGGPLPTAMINLANYAAGAQNNPWDEPPTVEWDVDTATVTPLADRDGKPFLNSAKQLIYPAPAVEEGVVVLIITRNIGFTTLAKVRQYLEKYSFVVNSTAYLGASKGQVMSLPPKAVEMYRGPLRYWRVTHRLKFKPRNDAGGQPQKKWLQHDPDHVHTSWQPKMLDAGMYEIRDGWFGPDPAGTLIPIFRGGQPVNYPVPLKDGKAAAAGDEQWLQFKYYEEIDFSDLTLPAGKL